MMTRPIHNGHHRQLLFDKNINLSPTNTGTNPNTNVCIVERESVPVAGSLLKRLSLVLSEDGSAPSSPCQLSSPMLCPSLYPLSKHSLKTLTTRRSTFCFVDCFSPLSLPLELFVYLLQFLSPGDLWRLCGVSKTMRVQVRRAMSSWQHFGFDAVRILHQQNANSKPRPPLARFPPLNQLPFHQSSRLNVSGQVLGRSSYWLAQAQCLVSIVAQKTAFEADAEARLTSYYPRLILSTPAEDVSPLPSPSLQQLESVGFDEETVPQVYGQNLKEAVLDDVRPLPKDRFLAMVDLLFDPNIVPLNRQRALINCARYVSSSIDNVFDTAVNTLFPLDNDLYTSMVRSCSVQLGPFLTVSPATKTNVHEQDSEQQIRPTPIIPPQKLNNYFQMMLWHRCLTDIVFLYNRIQSQHVRPLQSDPALKVTKVPQEDTGKLYPFCCQAHSLVYRTQPCFSLLPTALHRRVRRFVQKAKEVSRKAFRMPISAARQHVALSGRIVPNTTALNAKLKFCNNTCQVTPAPLQETRDFRTRNADWEETLAQTKDRIDERARQDTLMKQELLSLCHMACGLFKAESQSGLQPMTIMGLLRRLGPWDMGIWQEGEWQHAAIDLGRDPKKVQSHRRPNLESRPPQPVRPVPRPSLRNGFGARTKLEGLREVGHHLRAGADDVDQGPWQKVCLATIQLLAREDLVWGGNEPNEELSKLLVRNTSWSWIYHD